MILYLKDPTNATENLLNIINTSAKHQVRKSMRINNERQRKKSGKQSHS
jgi:hypothetical protein